MDANEMKVLESNDKSETGQVTVGRIAEELAQELNRARERHPLLAQDLFGDVKLLNLRMSLDYLNARQRAGEDTAIELLEKQKIQAHIAYEMMNYKDCRRQLVQAIAILSRMIAVLDLQSEMEGMLPW